MIGLVFLMLLAPAAAQASIVLVDDIGPIDRVGPVAIQAAGGDSAAGIWVSDNDTFPGLTKYSLDGQTTTGGITPNPAFEGDLTYIAGLAVDAVGDRLYLTDTNFMNGDGRLLAYELTTGDAVVQSPGTVGASQAIPPKGTNPGEFDTPVGVAFLPADERVYVADELNDRVQYFFDSILLPAGYFTGPSNSGPIATVFDEQTLHNFVAYDGGEISEFNELGFETRSYGTGDVAAGMVVDPNTSLLYVAVPGAVDIYSTVTGQSVGSVDLPSVNPFGIAIDPVNRRLYVSVRPADPSQSRVDIFSYSPGPVCTTQNLTVVTGNPLNGSVACSDPDALPFTYSHAPTALPAHGNLSLNSATGSFTYTPDPGYVGGDSFSYRMLSANGASQVTTTNVEVTAIPPDPPVVPDPVVHKNTNLSRSSGKILIKLPGKKGFTELNKESQVPLGTIVDARKGTSTVTLANRNGSTYSGEFWGGVFQILQEKGAKPFGVIKLRDDQIKRGPSRLATISALRKRNKVWGKAKGKFKTNGRGSSASVRGTIWLVANQGKGTLTRVREGSVLVRDFARDKRVVVKRGQSYFAPYRRK